jgi:hypothetical protein
MDAYLMSRATHDAAPDVAAPAPYPTRPGAYLYLDVETLDWFDQGDFIGLSRWRQLAAMRLGVATTYDDSHGWRVWWPAQVADLWAALIAARQVVGWNSSDFDIPLLALKVSATMMADPGLVGSGNNPWNDALTEIDLMARIKRATKAQEGRERWYSLEAIAFANLGRGKDGDGKQAAAQLRSGDPALVEQALAYCKSDVQLLRELHAILRDGRPLICPARPERREATAFLLQPEEYERC